jgi:hypothetical protein
MAACPGDSVQALTAVVASPWPQAMISPLANVPQSFARSHGDEPSDPVWLHIPRLPVSRACLAAAQLRAGRISTAASPLDALALLTASPTPATSPSIGVPGEGAGDGAGDGEGDGEHLGIPGISGILGIPGMGIGRLGIQGNGDGGTGSTMTGGFGSGAGAGFGSSFLSLPHAKNTERAMREMASFLIF